MHASGEHAPCAEPNGRCRWCNQKNHLPVKLINRLHESHPDSVPLLLLRGHTALMSGQAPMAIRMYFEVRSRLRPDASDACMRPPRTHSAHTPSHLLGALAAAGEVL